MIADKSKVFVQHLNQFHQLEVYLSPLVSVLQSYAAFTNMTYIDIRRTVFEHTDIFITFIVSLKNYMYMSATLHV